MLTMDDLLIGVCGILVILLTSFLYAIWNERGDTDTPKKYKKK